MAMKMRRHRVFGHVVFIAIFSLCYPRCCESSAEVTTENSFTAKSLDCPDRELNPRRLRNRTLIERGLMNFRFVVNRNERLDIGQLQVA